MKENIRLLMMSSINITDLDKTLSIYSLKWDMMQATETSSEIFFMHFYYIDWWR